MSEEKSEILMSQLADGELASDQVNELLLGVLDEPAGREKLKAMLRLRQATASWRASRPAQPVLVVAQPAQAQPVPRRRPAASWRLGSLAVAACVGGLLVISGIWAAGWLARPVRQSNPWPGASNRGGSRVAVRVSPEQMRQVAKVFALHESVAGPLAWYASDDQNVRLASASPGGAGQPPIGVLLRLQSAGGGARSLVIVCRNDQPAVIDLPAEAPGEAGLRVYLAPRAVNGSVDVRYAIAVDGDATRSPAASLTGRRKLGTAEAPLGQLAMGESLVNVEAAAWCIREEKNP